jgi:DNA/RNA-binding domain of Phe-tRNA-synthetase-like protein|tara:strand:+ start:9658 stop:9873 length:216 start_codon:yes stop_codon:yes gene_type:complete
MSELYQNTHADNLKKRIDKDYIYSFHKVSLEKNIPINHEDIEALDGVIDLDKSSRHEALKQAFVELTSKEL